MEINLILYFLVFLLFNLVGNRIIYQCSALSGLNEHCLNRWVDSYGNIRYDLHKCDINQYCQVLTRKYDDNSIGVCLNNFKWLYHGDKCTNNLECITLSCSNKKCSGFKLGSLCMPNKGQCENNLVCKRKIEPSSYDNHKTVYRCSNLSKIYEECETNLECDIRLVCTFALNINNITKENINTKKYCIERASLENGIITDEPMACKSGDLVYTEIFPGYNESLCVSKKKIIQDCNYNNKCIIEVDLGIFGKRNIEQNCLFTVKGNPLCPLYQKENAWNNYLEIFEKYYISLNIEKSIKENKTHIPIHKNTFNILYISKAFWLYNEWYYSLESDECINDFFFLNSYSTKLNVSFIFMIFLILIIIYL